LKLTDGGKGFSPLLKVKMVVLGAPLKELSQEEKEGLAAAAEAGRARHREEVRQVRNRRVWLSEVDVAWYLRTFATLCSQDRFIHKDVFAKSAEKVFGLPCLLLADRFFDMLDTIGGHTGTVGIRSWATMMEHLSRGNRDQTMQIAFQLYDIDGDGIIDVGDALNLVREEEALRDAVDQLSEESPGSNLCEEMKWVYNLVADGSDDVEVNSNKTHNFWWFRQVRPEPAIIEILLKNLRALGEGVAETDYQ
jgi:Ca2+-binding EF-hand superfamily protein